VRDVTKPVVITFYGEQFDKDLDALLGRYSLRLERRGDHQETVAVYRDGEARRREREGESSEGDPLILKAARQRIRDLGRELDRVKEVLQTQQDTMTKEIQTMQAQIRKAVEALGDYQS